MQIALYLFNVLFYCDFIFAISYYYYYYYCQILLPSRDLNVDLYLYGNIYNYLIAYIYNFKLR